MNEEEKKVEEHLLLKEEIINDLDLATKGFQEGELTESMMYIKVLDAWEKANTNKRLHQLIEGEIRRRRMVIHHQIGEIDISKGDPIRIRYNPAYWFTNVPEEFKSKEKLQVFILDRIKSLREFFVNLERARSDYS